MAKTEASTTARSDARDKVVKVTGWYQPHAQGGFDNTVVDPKTGEVKTLESRTKQSFVAECDINNIIKEFKVTGQIAHINTQRAQGAYVDLPDPIDFQDSLHIVMQAQKSFATLPSAVRNRFNNNPEEFLSFMADAKNQEEIIRLGLATDLRPPAGGSGATAPAAGGAQPPAAPSQTKA